ncbi:hypothetical protein [Polynucleobacter sp. MWH-P3-07-1]|uniref:hypothetical protein n=1 Tax=Polynucleobacter sp. MWH-P3-07-1 TaxID=1743173 RepID=UPI001BFEE885|nr:hypothetical protein [Polynucleobacter sp. MWH-P3-07-1]
MSNLTLVEYRELIIRELISKVSQYKSENNQLAPNVSYLNKEYPSLHPRMKEFFNKHMPNTTWREIENARKQIYVESGIADGKPTIYHGMTYKEVCGFIEKHNIDGIAKLPSKLNEWITSQGWKNQILQLFPMTAYSISSGGHACRSKYELIVANLLTELLPEGASFTCQAPYPFNKRLNNARQPLSCDFVVQLGDLSIWVEVFSFRPDSQFVDGGGFASARPSYLARRQRKIDLFKTEKFGDKFLSLEVSNISGRSKSFGQFILDALAELTPILHLSKVDVNDKCFITPLIARLCKDHSPMSNGYQTQSAELIRKASDSFHISADNLEKIHDLMLNGQSATASLTQLSLPHETLLGLSRLTTDGSWQLRRILPSPMSAHFADSKNGKGSSFLSFANAINYLATINAENKVNLEGYPDWVMHYLEKNSSMGQLGLFGMNYRRAIPRIDGEIMKSRNYSTYIVQWEQKAFFFGSKDILQSHTKGVEQAARLFVGRLLILMSSHLIINWEAPGSAPLIPNRYILVNPSPLQIDHVVAHIVANTV